VGTAPTESEAHTNFTGSDVAAAGISSATRHAELKPSLSYLVLPKLEDENKSDIHSTTAEQLPTTTPPIHLSNSEHADTDRVSELPNWHPRGGRGLSSSSLSSILHREEDDDLEEDDEGVVLAPPGWGSRDMNMKQSDAPTLVRSSSIAEALCELSRMRKHVSTLRRENNKLRIHVRRLEAEANERGGHSVRHSHTGLPSSFSMSNFSLVPPAGVGGGGELLLSGGRGRAQSQCQQFMPRKKHSPLQNEMYAANGALPLRGPGVTTSATNHGGLKQRPIMHRRTSSSAEAPVF
jgi:hypothetical protein